MGADAIANSLPVSALDATRLPGAARVRSGASHHTAIVTGYETREIIVASGIEFRSEDYRAAMKTPERDHHWLQSFGLVSMMEGLEIWVSGFHATSHTTGEYLSRKQGVRFVLRNVTTKHEFRAALQTPNAHVVYNGHARYGRGPCFGPVGHRQGDWWEQGDADTGIFRMGYPFIAVPASEITEHGYHARLALVSEGALGTSDCEPELAAFHSRLEPTYVSALPPKVQSLLVGSDTSALNPATEVWAYNRPYDGQANVHFVVLRAGWRNTASEPYDLGGTDLRCRVFCHFGCDTYHHNHAVLRTFKNWKQSGNEGYAYFTSAVSQDMTVGNWLTAWMTYDRYNAFQSWQPSLDHAQRATNSRLSAMGKRWRVV